MCWIFANLANEGLFLCGRVVTKNRNFAKLMHPRGGREAVVYFFFRGDFKSPLYFGRTICCTMVDYNKNIYNGKLNKYLFMREKGDTAQDPPFHADHSFDRSQNSHLLTTSHHGHQRHVISHHSLTKIKQNSGSNKLETHTESSKQRAE